MRFPDGAVRSDTPSRRVCQRHKAALTDMYRTTMAEMKPTPIPQMSRPATMTAKPVEAVSRIQPIMKTPQPAIIVLRRPIQSAQSPAMMAPKKVPQDKIEVVND